ncbi:adenosylcobinamide-GDP ribazoletransferase [Pseudomaricurvus alcaniphilus]|uniref:adenosylcobinamide-GDP ribazoletransferase n=1 Tax=Pseudomaricurvus alcaniphilus TaxID=1166482 RepID=UPI001A9FB01D|nr:adenosylcobinamide-GDP ribazoletransferase [Pseudomaricurvus alcaniphilus]
MAERMQQRIYNEWQALLLALGLLTRIPMPLHKELAPATLGRSLHWYPAVGLILSLLLLPLAWLPLPGLLLAALLLCAWVAVTGALHLDGLADCADAWVGGLGDRQRTLDIMKDPACGPIGVVALVLVLLLKFTALASLLLLPAASSSGWWLVPLAARSLLPLAFLSTPYVRSQGMGSALASHGQRQTVLLAAGLATALLALLLPWTLLLLWLLGGALLQLLWRRAMLQRLGGFTGDGAGALVELQETLLLVLTAAWCSASAPKLALGL